MTSKWRLHLYNGRTLLTLLGGSAAFLALILLTPLGLWQNIGSAGMAILCLGIASGLAAVAVFRGNSPQPQPEPVTVSMLEAAE